MKFLLIVFAKLAIAKVSDGYGYSFSNAQKAAAWGNSLGAVAINVSAETRLDTQQVHVQVPGEGTVCQQGRKLDWPWQDGDDDHV